MREGEKRPREAHLVRAGDEVQILNKHLEDFANSLAIPGVIAVDADHPVRTATSTTYIHTGRLLRKVDTDSPTSSFSRHAADLGRMHRARLGQRATLRDDRFDNLGPGVVDALFAACRCLVSYSVSPLSVKSLVRQSR